MFFICVQPAKWANKKETQTFCQNSSYLLINLSSCLVKPCYGSQVHDITVLYWHPVSVNLKINCRGYVFISIIKSSDCGVRWAPVRWYRVCQNDCEHSCNFKKIFSGWHHNSVLFMYFNHLFVHFSKPEIYTVLTYQVTFYFPCCSELILTCSLS